MPDSNELSDPDVWKKWQAKKIITRRGACNSGRKGGRQQKHTHINVQHTCTSSFCRRCKTLSRFDAFSSSPCRGIKLLLSRRRRRPLRDSLHCYPHYRVHVEVFYVACNVIMPFMCSCEKSGEPQQCLASSQTNIQMLARASFQVIQAALQHFWVELESLVFANSILYSLCTQKTHRLAWVVTISFSKGPSHQVGLIKGEGPSFKHMRRWDEILNKD